MERMDKWEYGEKYGFHKEVEEPIEDTLTERILESELKDLRKENEELKQRLEGQISLSTHFANLNAEIDRLSNEKLQLLARIDELKQPRRHTSSLRREMIANLDRLVDG